MSSSEIRISPGQLLLTSVHFRQAGAHRREISCHHSVRDGNREKSFGPRYFVSNLCIFCDWLFTQDVRSLAPV